MARYKPAHSAARGARLQADRGRLSADPAAPALPLGQKASPPPSDNGTRLVRRRRRWRRWVAVGAAVVLLAAGSGAFLATRGSGGTLRSAGTAGETEESPPTTGQVVGGTLGPTGMTSLFIKRENALPGTTSWRLTAPADKHQIEGYADRASVVPGEPITLYVSTVAPTFRVEAYRMGYYQGNGGRLIWQSPDEPGEHQAEPSITYGVNTAQAHWQPSLTVTTQGWPPGDYLFKLISSTGLQQYVPLTLRDDTSTAAYVVINAVTTWQAYNVWGGYDLYQGLVGNGSDYAHRARIVSFDRPYTIGSGAGDFLGLEYPFLSLVESLGLDVTYITDVDLHEHPELLLRHRAVFSMGHDEYYSMAMRNGLQSARDHGVNLAFLGANAIYRHIRFAPSALGPDRLEIDYKSAAGDPLNGRDNADVTVDWRDAPNNMPESTIIGDFYQCNPVRADMVITDPSSWLFAGSGAFEGERLANVVGSEYDRYDSSAPGPRNVEILTHSPLTCRGQPDYSDATYYTAVSGAGVFASGTIDFVGAIDPNCPTSGCPGRVLGRLVENLLAAFGVGPAGLTHPSVPNAASLPGPPATRPSSVGTGVPQPSTRYGTPSGTAPRTVAPTYQSPLTGRRTTPTTRPYVTYPRTTAYRR